MLVVVVADTPDLFAGDPVDVAFGNTEDPKKGFREVFPKQGIESPNGAAGMKKPAREHSSAGLNVSVSRAQSKEMVNDGHRSFLAKREKPPFAFLESVLIDDAFGHDCLNVLG